MKIILSGSTGFIGTEVLAQCLEHPAVQTVIAFVRRSIPEGLNHPKLKTVIMKDFTTYPDDILKELSGADACIWSMGTATGDLVVNLEYPLAFAKAFANASAQKPSTPAKKFNFVFLSGAVAERDQEKPLCYFEAGRRAKVFLNHNPTRDLDCSTAVTYLQNLVIQGFAETEMMAFADQKQHNGAWTTFVVKPGWVCSKASKGVLSWILGSNYSIGLDELAATMIDLAMHGAEERVLLNKVIASRGKELLRNME